ncbi:MAG: DEAD/DEAH box helicase [Bacteroidetes bacterium]|nr:MAG: DEAD/DEAH box helicase [Bacteroidota bacterium]
MNNSIYYKIIESVGFDNVPSEWKIIDFDNFSRGKKMYDYQKEALKNALLILYKYYGVSRLDTEVEKQNFLKLLSLNGLDSALQHRHFSYTDIKSKAYAILRDYYKVDSVQSKPDLPAYQFVNRMSFWMATGSGKSIVLVKLIDMLYNLMRTDKLPEKDILFLTLRPDLISQLKAQFQEFNEFARIEYGYEFVLREIKEVFKQKAQGDIFRNNQINIYYYRSDLVEDISKENKINFKDYENDGNWFVILDEAHKGESDESKRKQYYNIWSRNGFLFNFSATFTDEIDKLTTAYNLNLAAYIRKGFGKHLYLFQEEFKDFKASKKDEKLDFEEIQKEKIVLMSLIQFTYILKKAAGLKLKTDKLKYHQPLMVTLVNSVSKKESDLDLFFQQLKKIIANQIDSKVFEEAKKSLSHNFYEDNKLQFEENEKVFDYLVNLEIENITLKEVLFYVFNTQEFGDLEVRRNPKNKQELSLSVKSGDAGLPFALIKIGEIDGFIKNNLSAYSIQEAFVNETYFEKIDNSSVNILLGSRSFYEGWDSTRPNVINFVNIGTQSDAKKFILQSLGRGIRIEPQKNQRKRLVHLLNEKDETFEELMALKEDCKIIETLYVFGTNAKAIQSVLETLENEEPEKEYQLSLFEKINTQQTLFIPTYKDVPQKGKNIQRNRYQINVDDYEMLNNYLSEVEDINLLFQFNLKYEDIKLLRIKYEQNNFTKSKENKLGRIDIIIRHLLNYYHTIPQEFDAFIALTDEIKHYQSIKVRVAKEGAKEISRAAITFQEYERLQKDISKVKYKKNVTNPLDIVSQVNDLQVRYGNDPMKLLEEMGKLKDTMADKNEKSISFKNYRDESICIKNLLNHYYYPTIISESEKISWLKHIIDTQSEIDFVNHLEKHTQQKDNVLNRFDWWFFCKIDHTLDKKIYIPYIDAKVGKRDFLPDFVFWLQKGNRYHILYIDPKGTRDSGYLDKIKGYADLFEENNQPKIFKFDDKQISVHLRLITNDLANVSDAISYKRFWAEVDKLESIFNDL